MSVSSDITTEGWVPDFVIVGPQKCATTWMYEGLAEHPDVYVPATDSVHYFDMNYHQGTDWYRRHFQSDSEDVIIGEETASYIRSENAPARIAELNPDAKIIFSLRNPIDRAFSHYWHEKSKGKLTFEFGEVFENYDLYENWIRPGMYIDHIRRYEEYFGEDQLKLMYFDDLVADDATFIGEVYDFVGADPKFRPSIIDEKVNDARRSFGINALDKLYYQSVNVAYRRFPESLKRPLRPIHEFIQDGGISGLWESKSEYEKGMCPDTRRRLEAVFAPKTQELAEYTGQSFAHWFEHIDYNE